MQTKQERIPQRVKVLEHIIKHGYITDVVARNYGIRSVSSRISELGKRGFCIEASLRKDDSGVKYARYVMDPTLRAELAGDLDTARRWAMN